MKKSTFFKINLIYFIAMLCIAVIFVLGYMGIFDNSYITTFLIQIVVMFAIPLLMYSLLVTKNVKQTFRDFGFKKISASALIISVILGFVLYFINTFVANATQTIISLLGFENIGTPTTVEFNYSMLLQEFLLTAVLPGFCEEILHRGLVLNAGKKYANPRFCLLASSILFGLMHMNINQFFYATILGCLMGYASLASGSIYPSMIIHFMNNALSIYFYYGYYLDWSFASLYYEIQSLLMSNVFLFVISLSLFIALMVWLYLYLTKRLAIEKAKSDVKKIIDSLKLSNLSIEEAQVRINVANDILKKCKLSPVAESIPKGRKLYFNEKIFFYSSIVLGSLITITSFIYGLI